MRVSWREVRVGNHGTGEKNSPGMGMLCTAIPGVLSLEHEFQSELDEARVRAEVNT